MAPVEAVLVAEHPGLDLGRDLAPLNLQPITRFRLSDGGVARVDDSLSTASVRPVGDPDDSRLLAATHDLRHVVTRDGDSLALLGDVQHRWPFGNADTATFIVPDRLLVTVPNVETRTWQGHSYRQNTTHRVVLLHLDGRVLDDQEVPDLIDAGAFAFPHPTDGSVVLEFGMGQDGSEIYLVQVADDRIALHRVLENVVICGFSPDGERLLLVPHPSFETNPSTVRWPDLTQCGEGTLPSAGLSDDAAFDHYGCYLSSGRVLLKTYEHGLLLGSRDLDTLIPITLPGTPPVDDHFDIGLILGINHRRFAAALWQDGENRATVWELPA